MSRISLPRAFVAMAFDPRHDDLFILGIRAALEANEFQCIRMDQENYTGCVLDRIKDEISNANVVVAEITDANPNVFLEIGYAWGASCPTLLLAKKDAPLPFDVRGQKVLLYDSIHGLKAILSSELAELRSRGTIGSAPDIHIVVGDITDFDGDVIVNAANEQLEPGGGVCGAIHRAAGPELFKACMGVPEVRPGIRCPTGEARITEGYNLKARYVIHAVGPRLPPADRRRTEVAILLLHSGIGPGIAVQAQVNLFSRN